MEGSITYSQLAILIAFLLVLGGGIYGVIVLRKLSILLTHTNSVMSSNLDHMNRIIPNIAVISDNALEVSNEIRAGAADVRETLGALGANVTEAVSEFNEAADRVGGYAGMIEGLAKRWSERLESGPKSAL